MTQTYDLTTPAWATNQEPIVTHLRPANRIQVIDCANHDDGYEDLNQAPRHIQEEYEQHCALVALDRLKERGLA